MKKKVVKNLIYLYLLRNNILLDQYLNAKLGDFGSSQQMPKLLGGKSMITVAVAAKSWGYSPPEMDMCHVSHKSDVYSYGVVSQVYTYYHTFVYKGLEYGVKQYNAKLHVYIYIYIYVHTFIYSKNLYKYRII